MMIREHPQSLSGGGTPGGTDDPGVIAVAVKAAALISDGMKVGLGSGRASTGFIRALGERVKAGLKVSGVPTSNASEKLARELGIPLLELVESLELDLTVDGADEVTPGLDMVKGWGGALVRERIVAAASKRQLIIVTPEKMVTGLGERGRIPVEVIPLAHGFVTRKLKALGFTPHTRPAKAPPVISGGSDNPNMPHAVTSANYITDNGNLILDCAPPIPLSGAAAAKAQSDILDIAGVVDTGFFLGTASEVWSGQPDGSVRIYKR